MILVLKHLVLMSLALLLVPIVALFLARAAARRQRIVRPGLSWPLAFLRLAVALVVPATAQGVFAATEGAWPDGARPLSLALAGALYGGLFGNADDFPLLPSLTWGALGGLASAWLYVVLPASGEGRALCVAVFAATPVLAYRPLVATVRNRLTSGGPILPHRRILR